MLRPKCVGPQVGRAEGTVALTWALLLPLNSCDFAHHFFFSGHYIPSGLISFISHWLGCQNSFLHYCALLKGGGCCVLCHMPFGLSCFFFFFFCYLFFFSLFTPVAEEENDLFLRSWSLLAKEDLVPVSGLLPLLHAGPLQRGRVDLTCDMHL